MTDPQTDPHAAIAVPPAAAPTVDPAAKTARALWRQPLFWLAVLALALAAWQWTETRYRLSVTQEEVDKRLADDAAQVREVRALAKQAQETSAATQTQLAVLEAKLAEFQGQQAALEALYQDVARGRDEWALAEVEQMIALAAQQLQLAGNVQAAMAALASADARLARAERPQFLTLRKTIARDLGRLRALSFVDVAGIGVKLETVVSAADTLPLAFEERPRVKAKAETRPVVATANLSPLAALDAWWTRIGGELWREVTSLVRVERFDRLEPVLLSPTQAFFLRENLKLRLLNARLALLARDQATFRAELRQASAGLERHFEARDKAVQEALATLKSLFASEVSVDLPSLNDSLAALRALRPGRAGKDGTS